MLSSLAPVAAVLSLFCACSRSEGVPLERTATFRVGSLAVIEVGETDIVALDPATGERRFRYGYDGRPVAPFVRRRAPGLVCAPELTGDRLVLRYDDSIHVLAWPSGRLLWRKECVPTACPRLCAAVLDGGRVAVVTGSGRTLTLFDEQGRESWSRPVQEGSAVEAPRAVADRILVRTGRTLVAFDATGNVAWREALRQYR